MTNLAIDENQLDLRRRRLIFRAWHRGIREMDLILGQYVDAHIARMNDQKVSELEYIMSFEDRDLLTWITGEISVPHEVDSPLFRDIINYRSRMNFN
ncbi:MULTISPECIES: FAD assembly factor SdhE [unclassified Bartonella]|uniref:FAD assembly factor SdhE n=1 Tax=unclassified Bartonella TaxID=2645622 RepID=UPI00099906C8|nr:MULTISPECIES: succinate dehydrogenase assembly factor 2 [unclassified Bartonella]AQX27992.1 antitoxin CptB [Bartonella sp. JB15]AQX29269.1 antitoxin CptB [Bartonella sp. JB63]